jgi:hypothetical protein
MIQAAAAKLFQATPLASMKPVTAIGIVCAVGDVVKLTASRNSFHELINTKIAVANKPGRVIGRTTLQ